MKQLTYSAMAKARLRANKRQYFSLVVGIFLAVFLVTVFFLAVQGFLLAWVARSEAAVGKLDAFLADTPEVTDEALKSSGLFTEIGHVSITGQEQSTGAYIGYYDETGQAHMNRTLLAGRMPENAGEAALEQGTLLSLDLEREWAPGDTLELTVLPIDGTEEVRVFTLVGILKDQADRLDPAKNVHFSSTNLKRFPAILLSSREPAFATGRTAVHRTLLAKGSVFGWDQEFLASAGIRVSSGQFFYISITGEAVTDWDLWNVMGNYESLFVPLILGLLLAAALIVSCCVAISLAMEGVLSKRSEEIGMLRALGATKRQIRRIFGRESLLLGLTVSPGSILLALAAVWVFSLLAPDQMVLYPNPWLLIPIALLSVLVILLAGWLPLRRCSGQMPMSAVRDTAVLRKIKRVKSRKTFRVPRLISRRLLRLYPSRQIGSAVLSVLMLFSVCCVVISAAAGTQAAAYELPDFRIKTGNNMSNGYVQYLFSLPLSDQSIAQLRRLPHVKNLEIQRSILVSAVLEEKSDYLKRDNIHFYTEEEYMEEKAAEWGPDMREAALTNWTHSSQQYAEVREFLGVTQEMAVTELRTVVLDPETLAELSGSVAAGKINADAINAGQEVLVAAPNRWVGVSEQGYSYSYAGPKSLKEGDILAAENDCFYPGQTLPLIQLYLEDENTQTQSQVQVHLENGNTQELSQAQRRDATVTVGAVLDNYTGIGFHSWCILTTEEGLRNLGLYVNGDDFYDIYLDGDIDAETEALLVQRIEAIAARSENSVVENYLESSRENQRLLGQLVIVAVAITTVFASVAVSTIASSVTRRLRSDGQRIGMLRAVGADEKTILGCYSGQITVSILAGFLATVLLFGIIIRTGFAEGLELYIPQGLAAMTALALLSWLVCRAVLLLRVREIVSRSIIDNIREL